ncbi:hypothetical protein UlMin_004424 [Ulmus minor]
MASIDEFEEILKEHLRDAGNRLLEPPSSIDDLLVLLDGTENLLKNVEQSPIESMQDALNPIMTALISDKMLRNSDMNVKVTVASCISEITRITAPDMPYDDEQMKENFQLIVSAFDKLSNISGRCYTKAMSILSIVAGVKSSVLMLDLKCDALIIEMFQHFLKHIGSNHPLAVFSSMQSIMTLVLEESDQISSDLLSPLLASVRKENQNASPISWKLAENVFIKCAATLKPYLVEAVNSMSLNLDDYAQIVKKICKTRIKNKSIDDSGRKKETLPYGTCRSKRVQLKEKGITLNQEADVNSGHEIAQKEAAVSSNPEKKPRLRSIKMLIAGNVNGCSSVQRVIRKSKMVHNSSIKDITEESGRKIINSDTVIKSSSRDENYLRESASTIVKGKEQETFPYGTSHKRGRPKKKGTALNQEAENNSEHEIAPKEAAVSCHPEKKPQQHPIKNLQAWNTNEPSSVQRGSGKRKRLESSSNKDITEESCSKDINADAANKSSDGDENYVGGSASTIFKKCGSGKEQAYEPDYGELLLGLHIKVWWPMDKKYYEGVVQSYDPVKKRHKVCYADGDVETLNFKKQTYQLELPGLDLNAGSFSMTSVAGAFFMQQKFQTVVSSFFYTVKIFILRVTKPDKPSQVSSTPNSLKTLSNLSPTRPDCSSNFFLIGPFFFGKTPLSKRGTPCREASAQINPLYGGVVLDLSPHKRCSGAAHSENSKSAKMFSKRVVNKNIEKKNYKLKL